MTERSLLGVLGRSITRRRAVDDAGRDRPRRKYRQTQRDTVQCRLSGAGATEQQARGVFDSEFMKSLFDLGVARGKTGAPFVQDVGQALKAPVAAAPPAPNIALGSGRQRARPAPAFPL